MILNVQSCFGVDLIIGSLIFGYLHLMKDLTQIVGSWVFIFYQPPSYRFHGEQPTFSAIFLTLGFISLIITILFLNGLHQNKPELIKMFLTYNAISTVIYFILGVFLICLLRISIVLVPLLLFIVVYIYLLLVIRSYYLKMDNTETKAAVISSPAALVVE